MNASCSRCPSLARGPPGAHLPVPYLLHAVVVISAPHAEGHHGLPRGPLTLAVQDAARAVGVS